MRAFLLFGVAAIAGCSGEALGVPTTDGGPGVAEASIGKGDSSPSVPYCVPGRSIGCACTNGAAGAQLCASDGTYGDCACTGASGSVGGTTADGGGMATTADASNGDATGGESVVVASPDGAVCTGAALCALPGQPEAPVSSQEGQAVFIDRIAGDWLLCDATSVFGTSEAGLSITADGNWYKLYATGSGLVRGQGFDGQGTWTIVDTSVENGTSNPYQLNLLVSGGTRYIPVFPAFATNPRKIRFDTSVTVADYVAATCP